MEGKDLRKAGLKVTLPRLKILEILESSTTRHLSAEDIYRTLLDGNEDIGLATVYRVLTQFEAAGLRLGYHNHNCRYRTERSFRRRRHHPDRHKPDVALDCDSGSTSWRNESGRAFELQKQLQHGSRL